MEFNGYLGIDVSKEKLDAALVGRDGAVLKTATVDNTGRSLARLLKSWGGPGALGGALFCLEPTGHYSNTAVATLLGLGYRLWVANPADIRHSNGMQRGKNDRADALMIARYAHRFGDRARLSDPGEVERMELRQMLAHREMLVRDRARYSAQLKDYAGRIGREAYKSITKSHRKIVREIENAIRDVESKLDTVIAAMPEMKRQCGLLRSIPGVGNVLSKTLVVFTNGFTRFADPRALACHAGVAPFEHTSGSSIRGRSKVSHRSNKRLKSLLHLAALAAVRAKGDLRDYYLRKTAEGKSKMSVLNAVRNKIIHRIFAVLKRNSPYVLQLP